MKYLNFNMYIFMQYIYICIMISFNYQSIYLPIYLSTFDPRRIPDSFRKDLAL